MELRLVLSAVGIQADVVRNSIWTLEVAEEDFILAQAEVIQYQAERRQDAQEQRNRSATRTFQFSGAGWGVLAYIIALVLVECGAILQAFEQDWMASGRLVAGEVMSGHWWRTFTALTLHADAEHLFSNLLFGTVFGFLAGRLYGSGVAWCAIVLSGALGNFMDAAVQNAQHASIGASTAVFAALGLMVSHALYPSDKEQSRFKRWSPLIAGIALLGFTGTGGEQTNVLAHVTGFFAGVIIGFALRQVPARRLNEPLVQYIAGTLSVTLLVVAWAFAFASS